MMNKILEKLKGSFDNIKQKSRYFVFSFLLLLFFLLGYFIIDRTQIAMLTKLIPEIDILKKEISNAENNINQEDYFKDQVEKSKQLLEEANKRVKRKAEIPLILEHISRIANKNGLKIEQMMPSTEETEEIINAQGRAYYYLPVFVEARCSYHDLGRFIFQLENQEIFLFVNDFSIVSTGEIKIHTVRMTLMAVIYEEITTEEGTGET